MTTRAAPRARPALPLCGAWLALCAGGCAGTSTASPATQPPARQPATAPLQVTSPELASGTFAPELTCDGGDRPPSLRWGPLTPDARAVAIDLYDPDAPGATFTHWLLAEDHPDPQGGAITSGTPPGFTVGVNDFGVAGYRGPCPPHGSTHHYHLRVRALSAPLQLHDGFGAAALQQAVASTTVLGSGEVVAVYTRR